MCRGLSQKICDFHRRLGTLVINTSNGIPINSRNFQNCKILERKGIRKSLSSNRINPDRLEGNRRSCRLNCPRSVSQDMVRVHRCKSMIQCQGKSLLHRLLRLDYNHIGIQKSTNIHWQGSPQQEHRIHSSIVWYRSRIRHCTS